MKYRPLTPIEIEQLQAQDCSAKDWSAIEVAEHFDARYVRDTNFSGFNRLGVFDKETMLPGGLTVHSGIYHATLKKSTERLNRIGLNVLLAIIRWLLMILPLRLFVIAMQLKRQLILSFRYFGRVLMSASAEVIPALQ